MSDEYEIHPAATLFPMMTEEVYQGIKQDIAENGQQDPIVFWCDQILDGRNRLRACTELGLKPKFLELDKNSDPWKYVISHNLHRRHLTTSQRAAVAGKLATLKHGDVKSQKDDGQNCPSLDDAAKSLNVSRRSVVSAKKIQEEGSKAVQQAIDEGTLTVDLAAKLVAAVPDKTKQTAIVAGGKAAVKEAVKGPESPGPTLSELKSHANQLAGKTIRQIDDMNRVFKNKRCHETCVEAMRTVIRTIAEWK